MTNTDDIIVLNGIKYKRVEGQCELLTRLQEVVKESYVVSGIESNTIGDPMHRKNIFVPLSGTDGLFIAEADIDGEFRVSTGWHLKERAESSSIFLCSTKSLEVMRIFQVLASYVMD